jgi:hypothetical protein
VAALASVSSRRIAEVVSSGLAPLLKANGFRKQAHHFYRQTPTATCHIVLQSSQWNSPTRASFTINLWSYLPAIAAVKGDPAIAEPLKQKRAHCGIGIGHLLPKPGVYWWNMTDDWEAEA